jgi:hypothetical protein
MAQMSFYYASNVLIGPLMAKIGGGRAVDNIRLVLELASIVVQLARRKKRS